jgi:hypothetical protein
MVMPLNVIAAWSRRFWIWLRFQAPGGATWLDDKLREAYYLGIRETHTKYHAEQDPGYRSSGIGGGR